MIIIFWAFLPDDDRAHAVDPMQKLCHNFQGVSKIRQTEGGYGFLRIPGDGGVHVVLCRCGDVGQRDDA